MSPYLQQKLSLYDGGSLRENVNSERDREKEVPLVGKEKNAILVVSFGTSYAENRKKTIGAIEDQIRDKFDNFQVYRAFTSKMIKGKMEREGTPVYNVTEALEAMRQDGINGTLIVQPTHVINGLEYQRMLEEAKPYESYFSQVRYGKPLLTDVKDYKELAQIVSASYAVEQDEALVLMGHGSEHYSNSAYSALEYVFRDMGKENIFVGTVEGYPGIEEVKGQIKKNQIKKACLVPLMIVAGDHANNDMIGEEDSWKNQLEEEGVQVRYYLKGLGESKAVQQMFLRHIEECETKKSLLA